MKSNLQLTHDDLKNIIGGFTFYVDKNGQPALFLNKDEAQFIKDYESILASSIACIAPSGEISSQMSIYLTKRLLELCGFKNSQERECQYEK